MSQQNMVNTMQSEENNECIYISDESPSVPQISSLSKSPFSVSSNLSMPLVGEIEMEDISDEIIIPATPSPLLNNKRQQHITIGRGIKRTCLEKAFSTMSTSSSNCTNSIDMMDYHFPKEGGILSENNCKTVNGKESNITLSVTGMSKNDVPSKEKDMSFPHKFISRNGICNSARNGTLKPENGLNDIQVLGKPKSFMPRKRSTVVINSDSDDSTGNVGETSYRNVLHPIQSSYELRSSKEPASENKVFQKNRTVVEHCYNKPSSEKFLENCGLMKTKKLMCKSFNNSDSSSRGKSHICKDSKFQPTGLHLDDAYSEPSFNRSAKNQFTLLKRNPKASHREQEDRCSSASATFSYNNVKSAYSMNTGENYLGKHSEGAANQRNSHASCMQINSASSSSKNENGKVRRKHSHRGQIAKFPVEDSDTDVEFYDAKSDFSDLADSKRPSKASRKKKPQRRHKRIMDCLSSDSSSDISVVSEMHISPFDSVTLKQHSRDTESPDPVEQVRQMEEDERLAYMLQAQYDAELECNDSNEEICGDFNPSFLSSLSVDSASSSSESSSSSSFSTAAAAEVLFPYLVSGSLSQRTLRDINGPSIEHTRRSSRIQQRQQSIIGWMPESVRTVLSAWMPNFTEDNTYESLLEISEQIGEESRGLKKQQINSLPTRKFSTILMMDSSASGPGSRECQDCTICLCEYQNNDLLRSLPCCHEFHATCIDRWLKSHSTCPICRIEVSLRRQFGRKRKS